ncbi:MAG: hypothetical protein V3U34_00555 [candidate division NC10 bacterium]
MSDWADKLARVECARCGGDPNHTEKVLGMPGDEIVWERCADCLVRAQAIRKCCIPREAQVGDIRAREDRRAWLQILCALLTANGFSGKAEEAADIAFELYRKRWER